MAKRSTREQAAENSDLILGHNMLAIDPSSTSFGYAIFKKGKFQEKGSKKYSGIIQARLHLMYTDIYGLVNDYAADILAIERIRSSGGYSPPQLLWSVGVTMAAAPVPIIEVSPQQWKVAARNMGLDKTDENDAHCIGQILIDICNGDY